MNDQQLRALQAPLKERYRQSPESAQATLRVEGTLDLERLCCRIPTGRGTVTEAGLHPMAGGNGTFACSADMLLESLLGCAAVTFCAVATAMNLPIISGQGIAEGDLDFRGTLGVSRDAPVGFTAIRIFFDLETTVEESQLQKLAQLTERYCVVAQSLSEAARPTIQCRRVGPVIFAE